MLILFVKSMIQSNKVIDDMQALLASRFPNASISTISCEEALDTALDMPEPVLFITRDNAIAAYLDKKNYDVVVWNKLPNLSAKLDIYLQLQRYLQQFPLALQKWNLKEVLHNSADSIIYRAVDSEGKQAAIKRFKYLPSTLTDKMIQRLLAKLKKYCGKNTKGLVHFYGGGVSNQAFYLVMEYLKYGTLRQALNGCGNHLPLVHALEWFQEIVLALDGVHRAGLIHRDLKIENILLREDGTLVFSDYGVSKRLLLDSGFLEQELHCSPHYVSPEQITGDACSKASDIYSLGVIFYELLTGRKPYSASEPYELMMHHVMAPVPVLPGDLSQFQGMLDKMMAKNPEDRFSSALDAIEGLPIAA